ncbi:hypothetical protein EHQ61_00050 [Leptospira wolffii]|uniref:hypothetical protein n=1 Tax=Leptospira wolffii TaxID=409998 RepID=UPI0010FFE03E|nr:hypothetical protein [Leptospira wolffii]TGL55688.1 hypothetical protein EHQ61_00050 [Leptospira wolffii]
MDVGKLKDMYRKSESFRKIFDHFASRINNSAVTKMNRFLYVLNSPNHFVDRSEAISFFRELESAGFGEYVEGRKGWPSRFEWTSQLVEVGKAASGELEDVNQVNDKSGKDSNEEMINHYLQLRPELIVSFELPVDLSENEAKRLSQFMLALPFGED